MTNAQTEQPLKPQLDAVREGIPKMIPSKMLGPVQKSIESTISSFNPSTTLSVGDVAPDFELVNSSNEKVKLSDLLSENKSVILMWYRGGWCPYCNVALRAFVKDTKIFKEHGAQFVAISPELPDESLSTSEKLDLQFQVLSDVGLKVADQYGVSFTVGDDVIKTYDSLGVDFKNMYGNNNNKDAVVRLPVPATFVIDKDMKIVFRFVDPDFRNRAEPADVLKAVKNIA